MIKINNLKPDSFTDFETKNSSTISMKISANRDKLECRIPILENQIFSIDVQELENIIKTQKKPSLNGDPQKRSFIIREQGLIIKSMIMVKIIFPDDSQKEFESGINSLFAAQSISQGLAKNCIVAKVDDINIPII